jgi:hypothetical protein
MKCDVTKAQREAAIMGREIWFITAQKDVSMALVLGNFVQF